MRGQTIIVTLVIAACASTGIARSADPIEELKTCARMTDRDARIACLDNLGKRVLLEESADEMPTQEEVAEPQVVTTAPIAKAQPPPDNLGVPAVGDDQEVKPPEYTGKLRSCKQGQYGNWYFFLDNGHVWKEVNIRSRRFKECNYNVTITKGVFGYRMRIDELEKTIQVKRHK